MQPWELTWVEFAMSDGLKGMYAINGGDVHMSVDEDQLPEGISVPDRLAQLYDHFFTEIWPNLP